MRASKGCGRQMAMELPRDRRRKRATGRYQRLTAGGLGALSASAPHSLTLSSVGTTARLEAPVER